MKTFLNASVIVLVAGGAMSLLGLQIAEEARGDVLVLITYVAENTAQYSLNWVLIIGVVMLVSGLTGTILAASHNSKPLTMDALENKDEPKDDKKPWMDPS